MRGHEASLGFAVQPDGAGKGKYEGQLVPSLGTAAEGMATSDLPP